MVEQEKQWKKEYKKFKQEIEKCVNEFLRSDNPKVAQEYIDAMAFNGGVIHCNNEYFNSVAEMLDKYSTTRQGIDIKFRANAKCDVYPFATNCLYQIVPANTKDDLDNIEVWFGNGDIFKQVKNDLSLIKEIDFELRCLRVEEHHLRAMVYINKFKQDNEIFMNSL